MVVRVLHVTGTRGQELVLRVAEENSGSSRGLGTIYCDETQPADDKRKGALLTGREEGSLLMII